MDADVQVERARAVLIRLRDQLLEHQLLQPNPRTLVPADLAELFNDTLSELEDVYGALWVASVSMSRWAITPASLRVGGYPTVASVNRETLLSHLRTALRRLNTDVRLGRDVPSTGPSPSTVHGAMTSPLSSLSESSA
jgi:hypothetical protein